MEVSWKFWIKLIIINKINFHFFGIFFGTKNMCGKQLYKSLKSGNGTKISDEKWCLIKPRYLENKNWQKGTVKSTRTMSAYRLQQCTMFPTDFWKKLRIYLWSSGIFTFLWVLAPPWQHFGCRFLYQSSLVELHYRLIDLNQALKDMQGIK